MITFMKMLIFQSFFRNERLMNMLKYVSQDLS